MKCKESTMKSLFTLLFCLGIFTSAMALDGHPDEELIELNLQNTQQNQDMFLPSNSSMRINVIGQGVAPTMTISPAQAYAMAKRAATVEAYRLIAEKVKGVRVEGKDVLRNMMIKSTDVNLYVSAMVRNANVVETKFENGLCEVEMEITLDHSQLN
jgi:outer membrane protein FlgP